jgi:hypothetical protein
MLHAVLRSLALVVVGIGAAGCLPSSDIPTFDVGAPPPSCGNGTCEPTAKENCFNCNKDCPCCGAVIAAGLATSPEKAIGRPDGKLADIAPLGTLDLTLGREVTDLKDATDFEIFGTVAGGKPPSTGCGAVPGGGASILVKVWDDTRWKVVGAWTGSSGGGGDSGSGASAAFDLLCASVTRTSLIRLEAEANASAHVDAIKATSCNE